jgi:hypothetical protein
MLTILTATTAATAAARRLTTLERLKRDFLSPEATYTDIALNSLIDEASATVARYLNIRSAGLSRPTLAAEVLEEVFPETRSPRTSVTLSRAPVRDVTAVTEGEVRIPRLIDGAANAKFDFEYDAGSGVLRAIRRELTRDRIKVEYQAGFLTTSDETRDLPYEIETACVLLCQQLANRISEARGNSVHIKAANLTGLGALTFDSGVLSSWQSGLPADVRSVLSAYMRPNL